MEKARNIWGKMRNDWYVEIVLANGLCPFGFSVTKPRIYDGCKHPVRWLGLGREIPDCLMSECPLPIKDGRDRTRGHEERLGYR